MDGLWLAAAVLALAGIPAAAQGTGTKRRAVRMSADTMMHEVTIEDSKVFTRPWKMSMPLYRRAEKNAQIVEFNCVEFVEELLYGQFRKK